MEQVQPEQVLGRNVIGVECGETVNIGRDATGIILDSVHYHGEVIQFGTRIDVHPRAKFLRGAGYDPRDILFLNFRYQTIYVSGEYNRGTGDLYITGTNFGRATISYIKEELAPQPLPPIKLRDRWLTSVLLKLKRAWDSGDSVTGHRTVQPADPKRVTVRTATVTHKDFDDVLFEMIHNAVEPLVFENEKRRKGTVGDLIIRYTKYGFTVTVSVHSLV